MEKLKALLNWFKARSLQQKISLIGGLCVLLVGLATALIVTLSTAYVPLYYNLSSENAAEVVDYLKRNRIPYRLADSGRTIKVARDEVYETRLKLAGSQVMQNGVGFEIFDKSNLGVTEFVQSINYQRALQGELARTINEIKQVKAARVLLVMPKKRLFAKDQEKASASVILKLALGSRLRRDQVEGIMNLVAASVPGLEPEKVTVVDTFGTILSKGLIQPPDAARLTVDELNFRRRYENGLEESLQTMLERVVGKHRVVVRVSADLDFNKVEKTEELYDPDQVAIRSEHRQVEQNGGGETAAGVPGAASNVPNRQIQTNAASGGKSGSSRLDELKNYEISKLVSHTVMPVGMVKRISVAVMVDGKYQGDGKEKSFTPRSPAEIAIYTNMVKNAIGFNKKRGDTVEVAAVAFDNETQKQEIQELQKADRYRMIFLGLKYLGLILAILFVYFKVLKPFLRLLADGLTSSSDAAGRGESGGGGSEGGSLESLAEQVGEKVEITRPQTIMDQITEFAGENPEEVAKVIKMWLKGQAAT
jgi:flagellar M-ring protein FliF